MKTTTRMLSFFLALFVGAVALAGEAKVTLHLLDHTEKKKTETLFWIDWCDKWQGVVETKQLSGEVANKIIAQLDKSLLKQESDNKCGHHPIYGIEVTRKDGSTLKTSLCFSCKSSTFSVCICSRSDSDSSSSSLFSLLALMDTFWTETFMASSSWTSKSWTFSSSFFSLETRDSCLDLRISFSLSKAWQVSDLPSSELKNVIDIIYGQRTKSYFERPVKNSGL